ncbi:hypothetical protein ZWY2020_052835 [Hordeum vulgare]|nr:hypothetical protein ZWY2020_052835 [Hordeum vulgare]
MATSASAMIARKRRGRRAWRYVETVAAASAMAGMATSISRHARTYAYVLDEFGDCSYDDRSKWRMGESVEWLTASAMARSGVDRSSRVGGDDDARVTHLSTARQRQVEEGDRETVGTSHTVLPANTDQTLDASSNHTPNDDNANEDEGMEIMVQLGVTTLPVAYVLKRWTWLAEEMLVDMSSQVPGKVHEMPEESVILMKTTLMKNEFASLAKVGCRTADGRKIIAASTHTMSNTATPSVYTSPAAASSKNQGRSSNAAVFDPQIQGQSALLAAMSAPVMPNPAAPGVYSAQLGASTRQGHSTYVAPIEPNILGYGATATPATTQPVSRSAALGAYSARSALPAAASEPATQPMSRSATSGVYTSQAAPRSNNKGHSSRAAAFKTQNQCQNASMSVMSESASAWPMAPATTVISTLVGGSNNHHHSSHVVAPEPIICDPEKSNTKGRKRKKSF